MATAKSLTKPKIISILGSTIRVAHPDIGGYRKTALAAQISAAGTTMSVYDNNEFSDNDWFIIGNPGESQTEECDVNGAVSRGQSVTITNTLDFDHTIDAPVTRILERKIIIYGAATDGGTGTVIASVSASGVGIQWDKPYTEINLITTDTAYAYYYATFYDGTTASSASDYVASTGLADNSVEQFNTRALDLTNTKIDRYITREMLTRWANECQMAITKFMYQDQFSGRQVPKDWSFEMTTERSSINLTENENEYALSGLTATVKYTNTAQSIISVQIGDREPLTRITSKEMDVALLGQHRTELASAASAGDTSITVDDTSTFDETGSIYVGTDSGVTYTGKTSTTFTGIPASGTGAITATQAVDSIVLQGRGPGVPQHYCIDAGVVRLDSPANSTLAGEPLRIRFFKKLTALTEVSDTTDVTFYNVFPLFMASKIMARKSKLDAAAEYMNQFKKEVTSNALADQTLPADTHPYYILDSTKPLDGRYSAKWDDYYY